MLKTKNVTITNAYIGLVIITDITEAMTPPKYNTVPKRMKVPYNNKTIVFIIVFNFSAITKKKET